MSLRIPYNVRGMHSWGLEHLPGECGLIGWEECSTEGPRWLQLSPRVYLRERVTIIVGRIMSCHLGDATGGTIGGPGKVLTRGVCCQQPSPLLPLADPARYEHSQREFAVMVARLMRGKLGKRSLSEPSWQIRPDMSTHLGSLLPSGPPSGSRWQLLPDMSTHSGSLLP